MSEKKNSQTLLVTGATGGMGRACAVLAAERGYNLVLTDLDHAKLNGLAQDCERLGATARSFPMDVCDSAAVTRFAAELESGPGLDAVIHTVGLSPQMAAWDSIIEVDLVGTVQLLEKLRPAIRAGGSAVCISSMSAYMVPPNPDLEALLDQPLATGLIARLAALPGEPVSNSGMAYAYAKKALIGYVAANAMSWGAEGKRLVSISPGLIETDMGRLEADANRDAHAGMRKLIALQRDGQAQEIASAALFLASAEASYITGCDLRVDGGCIASFQQLQRQPQPRG